MTIRTDARADRRLIDYDAIVDELAYAYQGIFSQESVTAAVKAARRALEPTAKVREFLPVLVARFAREQLAAPPKLKVGLSNQCPKSSSFASRMLDARRLPPHSRTSYQLAESTCDPPVPSRPNTSVH
jgi:hypothetical protein